MNLSQDETVKATGLHLRKRKPAPIAALPDALLLMSREVYGVTRLAPSTVYRQIRAGKFPPPVPTGAEHRRWRREDIEAWLDGSWGRTAA
jgi:predicted DNA-binding transcriptional regulator AlpA